MFEFGQFNEFSDSVTISSPTVMATAKAIELGPYVGAFYQSMQAPEVTLKTKDFKVYTRSKTAREGIVGGSGWTINAVSDLPLDSGMIAGLTVGHVLQVNGGEVVIVKDVDRSANTIDVYERAAGSTTAATASSGTVVKVTGFAGADTDLKNVTAMSETTSEYLNYVQTVFEAVEWTKHATLVRQGMSPAQATFTLLREAAIRVAEMLASMSILGHKQAAATSATRSMSAGLFSQLADTNSGKRTVLSYNANGLVTEAIMMAAIGEVLNNGGNPDTIWCSPAAKAWINTFNMANSSLAVTASKESHTAGGQYVTHIDYEGKLLAVRVDRDIPSGKIAIVNQGKCKKGWLENDGLNLVDEPALSSREMRKSLQGSVGFLIEDVGIDHSFIYGITGGPSARTYNVNVTNPTTAPVNTQEVT